MDIVIIRMWTYVDDAIHVQIEIVELRNLKFYNSLCQLIQVKNFIIKVNYPLPVVLSQLHLGTGTSQRASDRIWEPP